MVLKKKKKKWETNSLGRVFPRSFTHSPPRSSSHTRPLFYPRFPLVSLYVLRCKRNYFIVGTSQVLQKRGKKKRNDVTLLMIRIMSYMRAALCTGVMCTKWVYFTCVAMWNVLCTYSDIRLSKKNPFFFFIKTKKKQRKYTNTASRRSLRLQVKWFRLSSC